MTLAILLAPLLTAIAGAFIYGFASNAKLAEIGRILFFVGALWTVYVLTNVKLKIAV